MFMKKIVQMLLVACMVILSTQVAFANSDKVTVQEGADLTSIHRLAVASPLYMQVEEKAPSKAILTQIIYDSSRVSKLNVISYDAVAEGIKMTSNVDIKFLDRRQAAKEYRAGVAKYADSYVLVTVANNSRTQFFFDVYKADTNQLLYTYQIQANRSEGDTVSTYTNFCEQFYKHLDRSIEEQQKSKK